MATAFKPRPDRHRYEVEVSERRGASGAWNVEAVDQDGSIEQAIFLGPDAEVRARRYAAFQYVG